MTFRASIIIGLIIFSGINIRTAFSTIRKKQIAGYMPLSLMLMAITLYSLGYILELLSSTPERIFFSFKIEYIGIVCFPALWLLVSIQSTGILYKVRKRLVVLLFIIPVLTLIALYTNNFHHLYYRDFVMNPDSPFPIVMINKGPLYYVAVAYMYLCILASNIIFIRLLRGSNRIFRKQAFIVVLASFIPWLLAIIYEIGLIPYNMDPGPLGMSIGGLLMGDAISRLKSFRITPIARGIVFKDMADPVLVLGKDGYLIDFNLAAEKLFPLLNNSLIGMKISTVPDIPDQLTDYANLETFKPEMITLKTEEKALYFQVRKTELFSKSTRVEGIILTLTDMTIQVELQKQLEELAALDGLTGIFNRRHFIFMAEKEISKSLRYSANKKYSLIMIDLDLFKRVNDTFGHHTGDQVLIITTECLKYNLRNPDILGRYGGEEFIVFLPETDIDTALIIAERLRLAISELDINIGDEPLSITVSIGVAGCDQELNNRSLENIIISADRALYRAKESGRNCVVSEMSLTD